ncbi:MAG: sulfotransferase, partial [Candidatus Muiribacteriota bacterium]
KDLDPVTQSAGQLYYINRAVKKGLSNVDPSRKIVVEYEDFCKNPKVIFDHLLEKLGMSEFKYDGPEQFQITRNNNAATFGEIKKALKKYMD